MMREGTLIANKYRLISQIGRGGMGTVWEALHIGIDRKVAIKFLSTELADSQTARSRFQREARAAGRIDHENVCEVLDFSLDDQENPYFVMPLLEGETLRSLISKEGPLDIKRSLKITDQILNALSKAHQKGIIHRDLKPGNIFLIRLGHQCDFVKILDFGITKFGVGESSDADGETLTDTDLIIGTPHYMAPEQARGVEDPDGRVDLYSVGIILFMMLTNVRPVDGKNRNEVLYNLWNVPIKPPSSFRQEIPRSLDEIILKSVARNRNQRYSTAAEFRKSLVSYFESGSESYEEMTASFSDEKKLVPRSKIGTPAPGSLSGVWRDDVRKDKKSLWHRRFALAAIIIVALSMTTILFPQVFDSEEVENSDRSVDTTSPVKTPTKSSKFDTKNPPNGQNSGRKNIEQEPNKQEIVRLNFVGIPDGAQLTIDGRSYQPPLVEIPKQNHLAKIKIQAKGYHMYIAEVSTDQDASVPIKLRLRLPLKIKRSKSRENMSKKSTKGSGLPITSFGETP